TAVLGRAGGVHHGGQLRHAHARDDAGGADAARTDADLHSVGAGVDQRAGGVIGGDVAGDDLQTVVLALDALDHLGHRGRVAVGGVDHHHVSARFGQGHGALV